MLITTCPQCHAKFCVTEAHLSAADGLVVCSRCRGIFQAKDHLQRMPDGAKTPPVRTPPVSKQRSPLFGSNIRSGRMQNTEFDMGDLSHSPLARKRSPEYFAEPSSAPVFTVSENDFSPHLKSSLFSRLFGGRKKTDDDTLPSAHPNPPATPDHAAPPSGEISQAQSVAPPSQDTAAATPTPSEEFSAVPEPQNDAQLALEDKSTEQVFLPGTTTGDLPTSYDPRFDPRLYTPVATREEMNWTMASIVALIVLIIQLFYIILQK